MSDKLAKEAFVSGLSGTSLGEISLITTTLLAGYLLRCVVTISLRFTILSNNVFSFLTEFATIVLPGILVFTILADYAVYVLVTLLSAALLVVCYRVFNSTFKLRQLNDAFSRALSSPFNHRLPFVTLFRTYITLFTAIAILAVDFVVFPRRLAKAETYGSGLMDIGVGTFMMAHGITAPEARCQSEKRLNLRGYLRLLLVTLRSILPLLVIGLLRLAVVKVTDYQEHVTEYGVHWNFFFTVAFVRLLCSLLQPLLQAVPHVHLYGLLAVVLATAYQLCLSQVGVANYLDKGPHGDGSRPTLFSANREGIISCVGYLSIYLGSVELGRWMFKRRHLVKEYTLVLVELAVLDIFLWLLTLFSNGYVEPVSRRYANMTYILWIVSYGVMMLALFLTIDLVVRLLCSTLHRPLPSPHGTRPPSNVSKSRGSYTEYMSYSRMCFVSVVDFNQLGFFFLANIFTGLVNFLVDTLNCSVSLSIVILVVYMGCLMATFTLLHRLSVKIKL